MKAKLLTFLDLAACVVLYALLLLLLGQIAKIFSPLTTTFFVLIGTGYGLGGGWLRASLTVSGLAIYILSWIAYWNWEWSTMGTQLMCGAGIITWIFGSFPPLLEHILPQILAARHRLIM